MLQKYASRRRQHQLLVFVLVALLFDERGALALGGGGAGLGKLRAQLHAGHCFELALLLGKQGIHRRPQAIRAPLEGLDPHPQLEEESSAAPRQICLRGRSVRGCLDLVEVKHVDDASLRQLLRSHAPEQRTSRLHHLQSGLSVAKPCCLTRSRPSSLLVSTWSSTPAEALRPLPMSTSSRFTLERISTCCGGAVYKLSVYKSNVFLQ